MSTGKWTKPKRCNRCGTDYPRTQQYFSGKGLKSGYCRTCAAAALSASQLANPKKPKRIGSRWLSKKLQTLKARADRKGVPFDLDLEFLRNKYALTRCEVTGIVFEPSGAFMQSLDRKDPQRGYTKDNVLMVAYIHNVARGAWGDYNLAKYVAHCVGRVKNKIDIS